MEQVYGTVLRGFNNSFFHSKENSCLSGRRVKVSDDGEETGKREFFIRESFFEKALILLNLLKKPYIHFFYSNVV